MGRGVSACGETHAPLVESCAPCGRRDASSHTHASVRCCVYMPGYIIYNVFALDGIVGFVLGFPMCVWQHTAVMAASLRHFLADNLRHRWSGPDRRVDGAVFRHEQRSLRGGRVQQARLGHP